MVKEHSQGHPADQMSVGPRLVVSQSPQAHLCSAFIVPPLPSARYPLLKLAL